MREKETIHELVGQYWDCAYKEGAEGRDVDINGDAGDILHAIDLEIAAIRHARDAEVWALKARVAELENELSEIKGQRRVWMDTDAMAEVLRDQEAELVASQTRVAELERLIKAVRPAITRRLNFVQWRIDAAKALGE